MSIADPAAEGRNRAFRLEQFKEIEAPRKEASMRKLVIATAVAGLVLAPSGVGAQGGPNDYCLAVNPVQPTCSFTVADTATTPVTGAVGRGDWIVIVKRGKVKTPYKSPSSGEPTASGFQLVAGDKVTAKALSPGSAVLTGDL